MIGFIAFLAVSGGILAAFWILLRAATGGSAGGAHPKASSALIWMAAYSLPGITARPTDVTA